MATRVNPRISVNKLGEYVRATPTRRRSIVFNQKNSEPFRSMWYNQANEIARQYFITGSGNISDLDFHIDRLRNSTNSDPQQRKYDVASADALEALKAVADDLELADCTLSAGEHAPAKLTIESVEISVRPDLILKSTDKNGLPVFGLVKFHFSKENQLEREGGLDVAATLHQYGEEIMASPQLGRCERKLCQVVEVFGGDVHVAPAAVTRRRAGLAAACTEIRLWWGAL